MDQTHLGQSMSSILDRISSFFITRPVIRSQKVIEILGNAEKSAALFKAIEQERELQKSGAPLAVGQSGGIIVRRVGTHTHSRIPS